MRTSIILTFLIMLMIGCSERKEGSTNLQGTWNAKWKTLPSSFGGISEITSFEMNGNFIFKDDSLTVIANGYPGCVFGVDTIQHTQLWDLTNDSLHLISENNIRGISYKIESMDDRTVELKLMEDIFLTLSR